MSGDSYFSQTTVPGTNTVVNTSGDTWTWVPQVPLQIGSAVAGVTGPSQAEKAERVLLHLVALVDRDGSLTLSDADELSEPRSDSERQELVLPTAEHMPFTGLVDALYRQLCCVRSRAVR